MNVVGYMIIMSNADTGERIDVFVRADEADCKVEAFRLADTVLGDDAWFAGNAFEVVAAEVA